jgi:hypothetical protein
MFDQLAVAIKEVGVEAEGLGPVELGQALVELQGLRAALEAAEAHVAARFDAGRAWADDGSKSGDSSCRWCENPPLHEFVAPDSGLLSCSRW